MRDLILGKLKERYLDIQKLRVCTIDYTSNPLAPETTAYRVTFRSFGELVRLVYYPHTVGFQGY